MSLTPTTPVRADHRFIRKLVSIAYGGKVEYRPRELDRISQIFRKAGGSWERIFRGAPKDVDLLKRVISTAYKKGFLTKKQPWLQGEKTETE